MNSDSNKLARVISKLRDFSQSVVDIMDIPLELDLQPCRCVILIRIDWGGEADLSVRAQNSLKASRIKYLGHLALHDRMDIAKHRNVGPSTLDEYESLLHSHGLDWETDINTYPEAARDIIRAAYNQTWYGEFEPLD